MPGSVVRVMVDGQPVDEDFDLDSANGFTVETASGRTFRVRRARAERRWPWMWEVFVDEGEAFADSKPIGLVIRSGYRWSRFTYSFSVPGHPLAGGLQHTLWNAVQSLTL